MEPKPLMARVVHLVAKLREGRILSSKELLHLGSRAAVDKALSRLEKSGKLMRLSNGMYVRPVKTRFGKRAPSIESILKELEKTQCVKVSRTGAAAANALGLTTQVPVRQQYLTTGGSRTLTLGSQLVELKHASPSLVERRGVAGDALRALRWVGPSRVKGALEILKKTLPEKELSEIRRVRSTLPSWLAAAVGESLHADG